ncbi:hypothetical protein BaRGS_00017539 [Batillaria attramentaria]|uniref:Uncharacterized protein n=1 Tax=Batillaria attramentaria TaxID=370345 RepID=A0ABD0KWG4_9CAEN
MEAEHLCHADSNPGRLDLDFRPLDSRAKLSADPVCVEGNFRCRFGRKPALKFPSAGLLQLIPSSICGWSLWTDFPPVFSKLAAVLIFTTLQSGHRVSTGHLKAEVQSQAVFLVLKYVHSSFLVI